MKGIINEIFRESGFKEIETGQEHIGFFTRHPKKKSDYFFVNYINGTDKKEENLFAAMNEFITEYSLKSKNRTIFSELLKSETFNDNVKKPELSKNTSLIYIVEINDKNQVEDFQNLIFSIEENTDFFKKYVLMYKGNIVSSLKQKLGDKVIESLNNLIDSKDEYDNFFENEVNEEYEFILRIFSKLPFVPYFFSKETMRSIDEIFESELALIRETDKNVFIELNQKLEGFESLIDEGINIIRQGFEQEISDEVNKEINVLKLEVSGDEE